MFAAARIYDRRQHLAEPNERVDAATGARPGLW